MRSICPWRTAVIACMRRVAYANALARIALQLLMPVIMAAQDPRCKPSSRLRHPSDTAHGQSRPRRPDSTASCRAMAASRDPQVVQEIRVEYADLQAAEGAGDYGVLEVSPGTSGLSFAPSGIALMRNTVAAASA